MAIGAELLALGKAYPIVTLIIGFILIIISFKAAKILKTILLILAAIAVVAAIIMFFT